MSFEAIQQEVVTWPDEQLSKLRAYLYTLSLRRSGEIDRMTAKLDDPNTKWVSVEDAEKIWGVEADEES
jgi:hypothetical protein